MLVAAAFCPHPPLLLPEVSVSAPEWLDELRLACAASVRGLLTAEPEVVIVVGAGEAAGDETAGGTMRAFGVDTTAGGADLMLPLSLTIGARLLDDAGWEGARSYIGIAPQEPPAACQAAGRALGSGEGRRALLVMGDGSAKLTTEAPGYFDERAPAFDRAAVAGLAGPDAAALAAIDPELANALWVAGRPAWQLAAGALEAAGGRARALVRYDSAPRGVGYCVVEWTFDSS